ncbi:MAG: peptidylprolyl isomerase [Phycisphaerae bacterium]|nr:peptidylprolyl isomerase [Phycisphaerae bacterium]
MRTWIYLLGIAAATTAFGLGEATGKEEARGPATQPAPIIAAWLRTDRPLVQAGREVWIDFILTNLTTAPVSLQIPRTTSEGAGAPLMGLPTAHVFSGVGFSGLSIRDVHGDAFDTSVSVSPRGLVPAIQLAPHGSVGVRLEMSQYYDSLRRPGKYTLVWRPYEGAVESPPLQIQVLPQRQAVFTTSFGKMRMRFYYEEAPNHVQNFIELVEQRFYDGLTFNRIIPGGLIQGGDPRGDRRGVRSDGKRLVAEFSNIPFELGTVGMARSMRDPDSASCQFFICLGRQPSFDGNQTAFGYLVGDESFETLRKMAAIPVGNDDRPREPVYIQAISLENMPLKEWDRDTSPRAIGGNTRSATTRPSGLSKLGPQGAAGSAMAGAKSDDGKVGPSPVRPRPADSQPANPARK